MLHCTMAMETLCKASAHDSWHEDCATCGDSTRYTLPGNVHGIVGYEARGQTAHGVMRHTRPFCTRAAMPSQVNAGSYHCAARRGIVRLGKK